MRPYIKLTQAGLKSFLRDRSGLFWTIFFPIFFIFTFGSIFGGTPTDSPSGPGPRMIDFVLPGILGMTIMQLGLFTAIPLITMRQKGVLKRLRATPLPRMTIVGSQVTQRLLIALLQTAVIVGIGIGFYQVPVSGSWGALLGFVVLGVLTFISLGALLSALASTQESGTAIVQMVNFPMMFLSGVFFPPELIPPGLRVITNILPLTYLADALRHIILGSPSLYGIPQDIAVLGVWLAACLLIASRSFRWE